MTTHNEDIPPEWAHLCTPPAPPGIVNVLFKEALVLVLTTIAFTAIATPLVIAYLMLRLGLGLYWFFRHAKSFLLTGKKASWHSGQG